MSDPHPSDLATRDPRVSRALATLPVPEHAPDFWARLDAVLDAEPPLDADPRPDDRAAAAIPVPPPVLVDRPADDLSGLPHIPLHDGPADELATRRRGVASRAVRPLLAAASVVLVIGLVRLGLDDGRDPAPAAQQSTSGTAASAPTTGGPGTVPPSSTVGSARPAGAEEAGQVLATFLDALGNGRVDDAAALVGPRSEAYLTAQSGSVRAFLTEATEGFGAWAFSSDRTIRAVPMGSVRFSLDGRPPIDVATTGRGPSNVATWTPTAADAAATSAGPRMLVVSFVSGSGTIFAALAIQVQVG